VPSCRRAFVLSPPTPATPATPDGLHRPLPSHARSSLFLSRPPLHPNRNKRPHRCPQVLHLYNYCLVPGRPHALNNLVSPRRQAFCKTLRCRGKHYPVHVVARFRVHPRRLSSPWNCQHLRVARYDVECADRGGCRGSCEGRVGPRQPPHFLFFPVWGEDPGVGSVIGRSDRLYSSCGSRFGLLLPVPRHISSIPSLPRKVCRTHLVLWPGTGFEPAQDTSFETMGGTLYLRRDTSPKT
jgi:hypothetical protein